MSDDDGTLGARPEGHDPLLLLYDFCKFLTTIGIFVLGGVLSLAASKPHLKPLPLVLVVVLVGLATGVALIGAAGVVGVRVEGKPLSRWIRRSAGGSMIALSVGTGAFLQLWLGALW